MLRAATEGADFAADRYDLGDDELDHIEERGRLDIEAYGGVRQARKDLPWLVVQLSRLRFGSIGPSTHFLELQEVEEILDPDAAGRLGLQAGQVTLQFHNGGGVLTSQLGALYARRKSASRMLRAEMSVQKPLSHLLTARSGAQLHGGGWPPTSPPDCPSIPADGDDGRRALLATRLAMNYGFAYRMATYAALRAAARSAFGATTRLVVDSPHNSIYEEQVGGAPRLRAPPQRLPGLPGGDDGRPPGVRRDRPAAAAARHQPDLLLPVRARIRRPPQPLQRLPRNRAASSRRSSGPAGPGPTRFGRGTARYRYDGAAPADVPHLDDHGVDEALGILTSYDLVRPVARMRPFAVLT